MRRSIAVSLALVAGGLGCKRDYPYEPMAARLTHHEARCRHALRAAELGTPPSSDRMWACRQTSQWLAMRGKRDEARALDRRLCLMGVRDVCLQVLWDRLDAEAAVPLCFDKYLTPIACDLAFTVVPPGDPRRTELFTRICQGSDWTCVTLLGLELAEDPAAWQRAVGWCSGAPPDEATCAALTAATWSTPAFATAMTQLLQSGCVHANMMLCNATALRFRGADQAQLEARRDLFDRACRLSQDQNCWRRDGEDQRLRDRAACATGDQAACAAFGKSIAHDDGANRYDPAFDLAAPTIAAPRAPPATTTAPPPAAPPPAP